jgi:hypothetical protein
MSRTVAENESAVVFTLNEDGTMTAKVLFAGEVTPAMVAGEEPMEVLNYYAMSALKAAQEMND